MQTLHELFKTSFPVEAVVECFVTRMRGRGTAALVAGQEPTSPFITLADGRRLRATSRGPGPNQNAINGVIRWINEWKANQDLAALSNGQAFQLGTVQRTPEGIVNKGQLMRGNEIAGWRFARTVTCMTMRVDAWPLKSGDGLVRVVDWVAVPKMKVRVSYLPIEDGETAEQTGIRITGGRMNPLEPASGGSVRRRTPMRSAGAHGGKRAPRRGARRVGQGWGPTRTTRGPCSVGGGTR